MQSNITIRSIAAAVVFAAAFSGMPAVHADDSSDFSPVQRSALPKAVELPMLTVKDPSKITVLILPVLDEAGTNSDLRRLRIGLALHRAEYELISRHFTVLGPDMATAAATSANLGDLNDPTNLTEDTMRQLAAQTHANWVVSLNIVDVTSVAPAPGNWTMTNTMHMDVYDADRKGWLINRDILGVKKSGMELVGPLTMTEYTVHLTTAQALGVLVGQYTPTVTVENEDRSYDYLHTQTKPFTGDPATPFTGLDPTLT